jgi:hypothetical protein
MQTGLYAMVVLNQLEADLQRLYWHDHVDTLTPTEQHNHNLFDFDTNN